jgi:hypothetical protein
MTGRADILVRHDEFAALAALPRPEFRQRSEVCVSFAPGCSCNHGNPWRPLRFCVPPSQRRRPRRHRAAPSIPPFSMISSWQTMYLPTKACSMAWQTCHSENESSLTTSIFRSPPESLAEYRPSRRQRHERRLVVDRAKSSAADRHGRPAGAKPHQRAALSAECR